jgi:hypothetical protein
METQETSNKAVEVEVKPVAKRGRGRPKGSKNKPKVVAETTQQTETQSV